MTATTITPAATLIDLLVQGGTEREFAEQFVGNLDETKIPEMIGFVRQGQAERDALRDRLMADPDLRKAVAPATSWKDAPARYTVAAAAVGIIEQAAAKHNLTVSAIANQLITGHGTIQDTIDLHGTDPRMDGYGSGNFYAFRCRVRDAVEELTYEDREREHREREAARDAAWEAQGRERCTRCGGVGGAQHWPGYTCFDCGGLGSVEKKH